MAKENVIETDVLVIGAGMAGVFAAIKAKEQGADVTLVDKGYVGKASGTHYGGEGFRVFDPELGHNLDEWLDEFHRGTEYINNREWTELFLKDSLARYQDLISWGVETHEEFESGPIKMLQLRGYMPLLRNRVLQSGIKVLDRMMVSELLKQNGKVVGAVGFHTTSGELYIFKTGAIVIATGASSLKSVGKVIHYWTADGDAMAYRAGAEISGKEFIYVGGRTALRSNFKTREETEKVKIDNVVDVLTRYPAFPAGIGREMWPTINVEGKPIITAAWEAHCGRIPLYTDLDALLPERTEWWRASQKRKGTKEDDRIGLDVFKGGKVEYSAGRSETVQTLHGGAGIWPVNEECASCVPGLYASGSSCATMVSGARYVGGGFGIMGAAVTGARAGSGAAEYALKSEKTTIDEEELDRVKKIVCAPVERVGGFSPGWATQVLQGIAVPYFILQVKHGERLQAALTLVEFLNNHIMPKLKAKDAHEWRMAQETKNMALNTEMVLRASLFRTESRGTHFREDYPRRDDPTWLAWVKLRDEQGEMKASKEPIPKDWWPDLSKSYEERYPVLLPGE